VDNYSPPAGSSVVNLGKVTVTDDDGREADDEDESEVRSNPGLTVSIVKTNDADRDGEFNDVEVAPTQGADVVFRAVVTNTSAVTVTITELVDEVEGSSFAVCGELLGTTLDPGQSVTCEFMVSGYSPPSNADKVNTVQVTVTDGEDAASAADTSTVRTGNVVRGNVLTPQPSPQPVPRGPLPRTGSDGVPGMLELAMVLMLAGIGLLWLSSRQGEEPVMATVSGAGSRVSDAIRTRVDAAGQRRARPSAAPSVQRDVTVAPAPVAQRPRHTSYTRPKFGNEL
jgi:hypothetical protein